jgi:FixJ family two-component response regulator
MAPLEHTVFVVDDDDAFRDSLQVLFESVGLEVETFASAASFLDGLDPERRGCLVLDVRMPGMSGLELQSRLNERGISLPIIFITGHGDVPMAVRAMKSGAVDFLTKPFSHQELLDLVQVALEGAAEQRQREADRRTVLERLQRLTPREEEVMQLVVEGQANKIIAHRLGISQRTVEIHRSQVMKKMEAASLAELVRMVLETKEAPQPDDEIVRR